MFTRDELLESIAQEISICKHLHSKLDGHSDDYQLGPEMRTTLELMRYLSWCGSGPADALINNDWSVVQGYQETAATMTAADFPKHLDNQFSRLEELLKPISDADFQTREAAFPWGGSATLGRALVNTTYAFLSAYRYQLFCHAKASGNSTMSTHNAWLGMDKPEEVTG